jgi:two-component system, LytTR family, sensor kinase
LLEVLFGLFSATVFYFFYTSFNYEKDFETTILIEVVSVYPMFLFGCGFYFFHVWFLGSVKQKNKLLHEKEAELAFLKHQVNPHFLLNVMNSLYGISLRSPELMSEKVLEISELLKYQIKAVRTDRVELSAEIKFCNRYLQYIQFKKNKLHLKNEVPAAVPDWEIPPLLFLPLIENAVKFSQEKPEPVINVHWHFEPDSITFTIKNNYRCESSEKKGTNLGIENLNRRREISDLKTTLNFTTSEPDLFTAELKIWPKNTNA